MQFLSVESKGYIYVKKKGFAIYTQSLAMNPKHFVRLETNDTNSDAWSLPWTTNNDIYLPCCIHWSHGSFLLR